MLKIDIITVQPKMFCGFLSESIIGRAVSKGVCEINIVDLREFGIGRWHKVDERPYGGGPGMLMRCEPWFAAVESCLGCELPRELEPGVRIIMTDPKGVRFNQQIARSFSALSAEHENAHLIFLCGHYEGFDERISTLATDAISIGDFVMTGGELAAAVMTDAIVRLLPGVLGAGPAGTADESFSKENLLEAPQYTKPPEFRGMKVPEILLSGDHAKIEAWKRSEAQRLTQKREIN
jgi:tRNA (guanine37-N1)-methyltransferase